LSDHLLRSVLIAQHCAASVDGHHAVKGVDGRCATLSRGLFGTTLDDSLSSND
jgi:hypothetical protein